VFNLGVGKKMWEPKMWQKKKQDHCKHSLRILIAASIMNNLLLQCIKTILKKLQNPVQKDLGSADTDTIPASETQDSALRINAKDHRSHEELVLVFETVAYNLLHIMCVIIKDIICKIR
jgi:hypothetical protein